MKKKLLMVLISVSMIASVFTGCGNSTEAKDSGKAQTEQADTKEDSADKADEEQAALEDGTYTAEFQTDSSMFHVNEAMDGKGTLTVEDGKMTIHISLVSKNIVNLFEGTAEDAQKDGAELLQPTTDTINYSDGTSDEVYGFDVPVPALDKEFDLALIGKTGKEGIRYFYKTIYKRSLGYGWSGKEKYHKIKNSKLYYKSRSNV